MHLLVPTVVGLLSLAPAQDQSRSRASFDRGQPAEIETQHLTAKVAVAPPAVAPGRRVSLFIDIVPKPKMHVYAPQQKTYIPISLSLHEDSAFRSGPPVFPKAEKYFFAPLRETQLVYSKRFRIVQAITLARTPSVGRERHATAATLTIRGTLRYQACDDAICYPVKEVPVAWTLRFADSPMQ